VVGAGAVGSEDGPLLTGKTFWHLVHLSFAPPGGIRRSSRLYVAWQDGHVTLMGRGKRLPETQAPAGAC
jgi:hypothetical protein